MPANGAEDVTLRALIYVAFSTSSYVHQAHDALASVIVAGSSAGGAAHHRPPRPCKTLGQRPRGRVSSLSRSTAVLLSEVHELNSDKRFYSCKADNFYHFIPDSFLHTQAAGTVVKGCRDAMAFIAAAAGRHSASHSKGVAGVEVMQHLCPSQTRHDPRNVLVIGRQHLSLRTNVLRVWRAGMSRSSRLAAPAN